MTKQDDEVRVSPASQALERSIRRALRNQKRAQKKLKTDPVHDFRVALRRCRSLAEGFSAIDPDPVWRRLRKASKRVQRGMSDLRDVQVLEHWLKPLRLTSGPVGQALASHFKKQERRAKKEARRSLESFPRKRWKRWSRRLPARAELIPVNERRLARAAQKRRMEYVSLISEPPHRNGQGSGIHHAGNSSPAMLWDRWRTELNELASINYQGGEESSRSTPRRALRARARANRYPHRPRRISSAR